MSEVECFNCHKKNNEVFFIVRTQDKSYICSECIDTLDSIIEEYLQRQEYIQNSENLILMPEQTTDCNYCYSGTDTAYLKMGDKNICLNCIEILFECGFNMGFKKYKKSLQNLRKLRTLIKKMLTPNLKIKLLSKNRYELMKEPQQNIKQFKLFMLISFSLFVATLTIHIIPIIICCISIILLFALITFSRIIESKNLTYLLTNNINLDNNNVKNFAKKNIIYQAIMLFLVTFLLFICLRIHVLLLFFTIIPLIIIIVALVKNICIYKTPEKLFDYTVNNIRLIS